MPQRTRLTIDKVGRIAIPNELRKELRLEPGDALEVERVWDQINAPSLAHRAVGQGDGVWSFYTGQVLPASSTDGMLQQILSGRASGRSFLNHS